MKKLTLFLLGLFCSNLTVAALLEKVGGSCPSGYSTTIVCLITMLDLQY